MNVHLAHLAVALTLLSGCVSESGAEGGGLCDAEEGCFTEGRIVVAFHANVSGTDEARQIVEDEGFTIIYFIRSNPRIIASLVVPNGEECAAMCQMAEHPLVDFAGLERTLHIAVGRGLCGD